MTPVERIVRELILSDGPLRLDRYMALALGHPEHGYYMARDPFGAPGDFITAPEISQVFGELIGVWCMAAWQVMGAPSAFNLVELGPGRGTLMSDLLRASKVMPGFALAVNLHLVETSPRLRAVQRNLLGDRTQWQDSLATVPEGPTIFVANEFFDALPIRQFERRDGCWHERVVGVLEDRLTIGLSGAELDELGSDGDVIEFAPARAAVASTIGERLSRHPGAALIIDYGHLQSAPGDTLQAMRGHSYQSVTAAPGQCDLTSHVDFEALGKAIVKSGAAVWPVLTQRDFLLAMGLEARTAGLVSKADAATRAMLRRSMARLANPDRMGNLFKVLAASAPGLATPYPFGPR